MPRTADPRAKIELLRSAETVFAEKGLTAARIEEITKRAGLSKGAFYLHFESKEAVFLQVVESFLARLRSCMISPDEVENLPADPAEVVEFCHRRDVEIYEFLWQNRAILAILQTCEGEHVYLMQAFRDEMVSNCRAWIELWKQIGLFRQNVDSDVGALLFSGAYNELACKMIAMPQKPPIDDWLRQALSVFIDGMGTATLSQAFGRFQNRGAARANGNKSRGTASKAVARKPTFSKALSKGAG